MPSYVLRMHDKNSYDRYYNGPEDSEKWIETNKINDRGIDYEYNIYSPALIKQKKVEMKLMGENKYSMKRSVNMMRNLSRFKEDGFILKVMEYSSQNIARFSYRLEKKIGPHIVIINFHKVSTQGSYANIKKRLLLLEQGSYVVF